MSDIMRKNEENKDEKQHIEYFLFFKVSMYPLHPKGASLSVSLPKVVEL